MQALLRLFQFISSKKIVHRQFLILLHTFIIQAFVIYTLYVIF